jgi:hypothetical protein
MYAAQHSHEKVMRALLTEFGADVNAVNEVSGDFSAAWLVHACGSNGLL